MEVDPGPYDLDETRIILGPGGDATAKAVTPNFYAELDAEFGGFKGHVLVSRHEFSEAWGMWEKHPLGDEIVYLISGDVDFVLWTVEGEKTVRVNRPGSCVVVPKDVWHTVRPHAHSTMLFITPGEGTQNAEAPTAFA